MYDILIVFNIPKEFGSSDLRSYFSAFVETDKFLCFHYKRRPEALLPNFDKSEVLKAECSKSEFCCPVKISRQFSKQFIDRYNEQHWMDVQGKDLDLKCFITNGIEAHHWTNMKENITPSVYPRGNVGTPTSSFMEAIRYSRLPPTVIKKLQLCSNIRRPLLGPLTRGRENPRGFVPSTELYDNPARTKLTCNKKNVSKAEAVVAEAVEETSPADEKTQTQKKPSKVRRKKHLEEDESDKGDDEEDVTSGEEEEWDRHRTLHDDVSARRVISDPDDLEYQQGTQERRYEEPMEVTWEKGGSGLVFYTDEQYWREIGQDDSDEADDWDVDMEGYDVEGGGDHDNQNFMSMDKFNKLESGRLHISAFKSKKSRQSEPSTGYFERHTKGVGRKLMEQQGWTDGQGLGSSLSGISRPVSAKGSIDRAGLGYKYHPHIYPKASSSVPKKKEDNGIKITTIFDGQPKRDQ